MTTVKAMAFWIVMLLGSIAACANQTKGATPSETRAIQHTVEAQVYLRPWNSKEFGEIISSSRLTVITSPNLRGDIVILRWNEDRKSFLAEIYRPDADSENPDIWNLLSAESDKSIVRQPNGGFHISEMVGGKDGGRRLEAFRFD